MNGWFERLKALFDNGHISQALADEIGLVHGRMDELEKLFWDTSGSATPKPVQPPAPAPEAVPAAAPEPAPAPIAVDPGAP